MGNVQSAWDTFYNHPAFRNGKYDIDPVGILVIGVHCVLTLLYFLFVWVIKLYRRWRGMDPRAAGMFRLAAAKGDLKKLEDLKKGLWHFDINAKLDDGWTALHAACVAGQPDSLKWLLDNGADALAFKDDRWKDTALHYAAASGNKRCVQLLLAAGLSPAAKNFAGLPPVHYAQLNNHTEVVALLNRAAGVGMIEGKQEALAGLREGDTFYNQHAAQAAAPHTDPQVPPAQKKQRLRKRLAKICARGYEGAGTAGTVRSRGTWRFRILGTFSTFIGAVYLIWRALRSLTGGWMYLYSIPLWTCEYLGWILWFNGVIGLWHMIDRPPRDLREMMSEDEYPTVDVYVVTYSEGVEVVEPTTIAALNMNYPADKLTVYILDDGKRADIRSCAMRLDFQCQFFKKAARLCYIAREKVKGVEHHAKAGNINHALLKGGCTRGDYVLILDSDMLAHPDFLVRTLGHMFCKDPQTGKWVPKDKVGFIQTPQDFWNLERKDPLFHLNSFFFGPMLKGRDGANSTPCAGTGVVFKRDTLMSIGGQAYGSITEDFNTSMHLLKSGFANMYLDEHMTFGMAPEDVPQTFQQRLRWAMGAIQVYFRDNPLKIPGLSTKQAILFWDVCFSHFTALCIVFVSIVPIVYIFSNASPIRLESGHMWEFTLFFLAYYVSNRVTLWWSFMGAQNGMHNLWRATQQCVWLAPNHIKAVWKVARTEIWFLRWMSRVEIGFAVTQKGGDKTENWRTRFMATFKCVWPFVLYYLVALGALAFIIATIGKFAAARVLGNFGAWGWVLLTMLAMWPPLYTLLPRLYTDNGWKVSWNVVRGGATEPAAAETEMAAQKPGAAANGAMNGAGLQGDKFDSIPLNASIPLSAPVGNASMRKRMSRRPSRRDPNNVAVDLGTQPSMQVASNFGRVGVGPEYLASLQGGTNLANLLPTPEAEALRSELAGLYDDVVSRLATQAPPPAAPAAAPAAGASPPKQAPPSPGFSDNGTGNGDAGVSAFASAARFPPIFHAADSADTIHEDAEYDPEHGAAPRQGDPRYPRINPAASGSLGPRRSPRMQSQAAQAQAAPSLQREYTLGPFALRLHAPAYDVSDAHDLRGRDDEGVFTAGPGAPTGMLHVVSPQVIQAVQAVAAGRLQAAPSIDTQWVTEGMPTAAINAQFVTIGGGKTLGVPLLAEALEYALSGSFNELERQALFVEYLIQRAGGPQPGTAGAQMAESIEGPAPAAVPEGVVPDPKVLGQPDFRARHQPPPTYTFAIVFTLLIIGLAVAGILDAAGVFT